MTDADRFAELEAKLAAAVALAEQLQEALEQAESALGGKRGVNDPRFIFECQRPSHIGVTDTHVLKEDFDSLKAENIKLKRDSVGWSSWVERAERAEAALAEIDLILDRRDALANCKTRADKILKCVRLAASADPKNEIAKLEAALLRASSIGLSLLTAHCGAYESQTAYQRGLWDELSKLHAMCGAAFDRNRAVAKKEGQ